MFTVCRVIGNELPPRDSIHAKLKCLEYILNNEYVDFDRLWVLNHILDEKYRSNVIEILESYKQKYVEIKFNSKVYACIKSKKERLKYAININSARNYGIARSFVRSEYVVSMDQDCYFTESLWEEIKRNVSVKSDKNYFTISSKRIVAGDKLDLDLYPNDENMIIFTRRSQRLFDENIEFGNNDKLELLWSLGVRKENNYVSDTQLSGHVGFTWHVGFENESIEKNVVNRCDKRRESLDKLLRQLDSKYLIKFL